MSHKNYDPGGKKYYVNNELIDLAVDKKYYMPEQHFFMGFNSEFLENDFKKNYSFSNYFPNNEIYKISLQIYRNYILMYSRKEVYHDFDTSYNLAKQGVNPQSSTGIFFGLLGVPLKSDMDKFISMANKAANIKVLQFLNLKIDQDITGDQILYLLAKKVFSGENIPVMFKISPKCEVRPLSKFENKKQRTFAAPDYLFYIIGKMLYECHLEQLKFLNKRLMFGLTGFNHYYGGWDYLTREMLKCSSLWAADDISGMDGSYSCQLLYDSIMSRPIPEGEEFCVAREWYIKNTLSSYVAHIDGNILLLTGKNKSGDFLTLEHNNFASSMNIIYTIVKNSLINNLSPYQVCSHFINEYRCPIMGDDSLRPQFHFDKIDMFTNFYSNCFELGFVVASELPGEYNKIEDLVFLNRSFYFSKEYKCWLAKPNVDKIFAKIYYEFKHKSWRYCLAKLICLRFVLFGFKEYDDLQQLITYVMFKHMDDMVGEVSHEKQISMAQLLSAYAPIEEVQKVVLGIDA